MIESSGSLRMSSCACSTTAAHKPRQEPERSCEVASEGSASADEWLGRDKALHFGVSVGLAAYLLGPVAKKIIEDLGLGAIALAVLAIVAYVAWWWRRRRREESAIERRAAQAGRPDQG